MSTNFWELLQQHQNDLTKSGHMVADYLVQHAAEAQYLSISSLARECKVAEATVFRFCRALGFEGYHEMRIALAQANATGVLVNQQAPSPDADTTTLCEHASALFMTAINGTQNALSPEAVDQAVALLRQAKQVYCMGQGGSMVVADEICARFACVTNKFRATGDSHMQIMAASLMTPQDVVLFVSYSGATRDMMETLRVVKETGAKVILITHYEDSPGAKQISCCCAVPRKAPWIPAASPSRWRCCMWQRCWCCGFCWMTSSAPPRPRSAPLRPWP